MSSFVFDKQKNNIVVLLTLDKSKKIFVFTNFRQVTYISLQNSLRRNWMPEQPLLFTYWLLRHPVFWFIPLSQHSQLGYLWLPTPHCAALVWLTGRYAMPLVTKYFSPSPYLEKWRISLGVTSILSMCLHPHT